MPRLNQAMTSTIPLLRTIALNVQYYRNARNWSAQTLAAKSGISRVTIYRVECGRQSYHLSTLQQLAAALQVPVQFLLKEPQ